MTKQKAIGILKKRIKEMGDFLERSFKVNRLRRFAEFGQRKAIEHFIISLLKEDEKILMNLTSFQPKTKEKKKC